MELSLFEACRKKRLTLVYAITAFAIALFYAAVCTPIQIWAYSNILVSETVFLILGDGVVTAVGYAFYWVSFAFVLYFLSRFTAKSCKSVLGVYLGASAFLYLASLLSSCLVNGFEDFVLNDLLDVLMYVGLDAAQMAIVFLIGWKLINGRDSLPIPSLLQWKNPMARSAFLASAVSALIHIASRIRYDLFYGIPTDTADLLWMISAYVSELVALIVGYLLIVLLLNLLEAKEAERRKNYSESI